MKEITLNLTDEQAVLTEMALSDRIEYLRKLGKGCRRYSVPGEAYCWKTVSHALDLIDAVEAARVARWRQ